MKGEPSESSLSEKLQSCFVSTELPGEPEAEGLSGVFPELDLKFSIMKKRSLEDVMVEVVVCEYQSQFRSYMSKTYEVSC